jgi:hypothetical protein
MHGVFLTFHALIEFALSLKLVIIFIFWLLGELRLLRRGLLDIAVVSTAHVLVLHALSIPVWVDVLLLILHSWCAVCP